MSDPKEQNPVVKEEQIDKVAVIKKAVAFLAVSQVLLSLGIWFLTISKTLGIVAVILSMLSGVGAFAGCLHLWAWRKNGD